MRRGGYALSVKKVRDIYKLSEQGLSSRQIADKLGITRTTAQQYLRRNKEEGIRIAKEMEEALKPLPISSEQIKSDEMAKNWLNSYDGTSRVPELGLQYFCNVVNKEPHALIEEAEREIRGGKLLRERSYIRYVENFRQWLKDEGYAPITALNYVSSIRAFYRYYYIEMPRMRKRKSNVVQALEGNRNHRIGKEDIRDMLAVCRHLRDKAFVLTAASSGMGSAELRNLKVAHFWNGLEREYEICKIRTIRVKTGLEFITFLSAEAVDMIWEYLSKERKITQENIKTHLEEPLFAEVRDTYSRPDIYKPLSANAITAIFKNIALRLDRYEPNIERDRKNIIQNRLRSHNMRKFFNTELKNAGCPDQAVETMLAHKNGVKDAYYLDHEDELRDLYLEYMPAITIQPTETHVLESKDYKELKESLEVYEAALKERNGEITKLREEVEAMKAREAEKAPIDPIISKLMSNPEVQKLLERKMEELLGQD